MVFPNEQARDNQLFNVKMEPGILMFPDEPVPWQEFATISNSMINVDRHPMTGNRLPDLSPCQLLPIPTKQNQIKIFSTENYVEPSPQPLAENDNMLTLKSVNVLSIFDGTHRTAESQATVQINLQQLVQRYNTIKSPLPTHNTPVELRLYDETAIDNHAGIAMDLDNNFSTYPTDGIPSIHRYSHFPDNWVAIVPTQLQQEKCDEVTLSSKSSPVMEIKYRLEKMMEILNHPLVANADDFGWTLDDPWNGSGKTQFIKDLLEKLIASGLDQDIAIVTYNIDMENMFFRLLRKQGVLCVRLNAVFDDWDQEYGVLLKTKEHPMPTYTHTVNLAIITDTRIQNNHPIFSKLADKHSHHLRFIRLISVGSIEERAQTYLTQRGLGRWWDNSEDYFSLIRQDNAWIPAWEGQQTRTMFVQSVNRWLINGALDVYRLESQDMKNFYTDDTHIIPSSEPEQEASVPTLSNDTITASTALSTATEALHPVPLDLDASTSTTIVPVSILPQESTMVATVSMENRDRWRNKIYKLFEYCPFDSNSSTKANVSETSHNDDESFYSANEYEVGEAPSCDSTSPSSHVTGADTQGDKMLRSQILDLQREYIAERDDTIAKIKATYKKRMKQLQQKYQQEAQLLIDGWP